VHSYTLLVFDDLLSKPRVVIVEATNDAEAIAAARARHPSRRRELWSGNRFVSEML
jgi:hypothetical protein